MYQQQQSSDSQDLALFRTVLTYCVFILALPICAFFASKFFLFDGILAMTTINSNVYSAVTAVVTLHLALGCYIYRAYSYDHTPKAPAKVD
ncbi:vacuolar ATPase assembly integral membrane protein VMA21 homolog [Macrosteles quadrilineatus]|uniref:vacuolar ATPase assembly integral membrane protein VMA21 homolog n=1 Tax=Macrosteles quadrilineatus TaxID=74068 RepID=UPI0023E31EB1|nr:vacuolar ATPase assembly integral membrane protein VMA21 homolog [Macrosteles quadrilineatus]